MKLQRLIFITLLAVGLTPLLVFITLNFPKVLVKLKEAGEERQLLTLQQDFRQLDNLMERRRESLRILSKIPGVLDLATSAQDKIPSSLIRKRLSNLLISWYDSDKDITGILIIDSNGKERLNLSRNTEGNLTLSPVNGNSAYQEDQTFLERQNHQPSTTFSAGLHLHKLAGSKQEIPHTHLAVTIGRSPHDSRGMASMQINLPNFLEQYPDYFLIRGDGAYIRTPVENQINHQPTPGEAYKDFNKLESSIGSANPQILRHNSLGNIALLPLLINEHPANNLWVGHKITRKNIKTWLTSYLSVFIALLLVMALLITIIANKISAKIDAFVRELTTGLTRLLESYTPMEFSWNGPIEIKGLGSDLTRLAEKYIAENQVRKQMEKDLQEINRQQEMILGSAAEGILGIDNDGIIIFANKSAEAMFGYAQGELLEKNAHDTLHYRKPDGTRYPQENCPFCQALSRKNPILSAEDVFWLKNGLSINVEYNASPLYDELGKPQGAVMCLQDIGLRKKQEQEMEKLQKQLLQAQKLEAVGTLAGGVAHDFNNLLTVIIAHSELLSLDLHDQEDLLPNAREIKIAAKKAADLTRQLLSFCRENSMDPIPVDLNELISGVEKMVKRLIGENIELEVNADPDLGLINADPGQIEQVLMNLIINARDAMPDGGKISINTAMINIDQTGQRTMPESRTGTFILLTVTDNGSGISRDDQARIFDPFFSTKGAGKGTGLGLSVVYGIIQQHGGWINVYSELNRGTVFRIYLPVSETDKVETSSMGLEEEKPPPGNLEKILLVEDDDQVRHIASALLVDDGYEVREAECLEKALDILREEGDDLRLLISDIVLPDGYGPDLADRMLSDYPEIPVIICSGYDDKSRWPLINEKGLPFLRKPFTGMELLRIVKEVLTGKNIEKN